jgi:phage terminase Nu1 subunit (DNA packaging protein)
VPCGKPVEPGSTYCPKHVRAIHAANAAQRAPCDGIDAGGRGMGSAGHRHAHAARAWALNSELAAAAPPCRAKHRARPRYFRRGNRIRVGEGCYKISDWTLASRLVVWGSVTVMAGRIVSLSAAAELFDVSVNTVKAWLRRGMPATKKQDSRRDLQIDPAVVLAWHCAEARAEGEKAGAVSRPAPIARDGEEPVDSDIDEAKRRKAWAEAKKAEAEYAQLIGELAVIDDIVKPFMDAIASFRAKLLSIPQKVAPLLAAETNVVAARNLLEAELREALQEFSNNGNESGGARDDPEEIDSLPEDGDAAADPNGK